MLLLIQRYFIIFAAAAAAVVVFSLPFPCLFSGTHISFCLCAPDDAAVVGSKDSASCWRFFLSLLCSMVHISMPFLDVQFIQHIV